MDTRMSTKRCHTRTATRMAQRMITTITRTTNTWYWASGIHIRTIIARKRIPTRMYPTLIMRISTEFRHHDP